MQAQVRETLEAGGVVLAAHARLARSLAAGCDQQQQEQGKQAWQRAAVHTLEAWLAQAWQGAGDRLLLSAAQEARLWEGIIAG
ncbi:MAG: hypothetical protein ACRD1E_09480, partial [Terriglobales bacterium]